MLTRLLLIVLVMLTGAVTQAEQRCDCSQQSGDCKAEVGVVEGLLRVTTDTGQCAQVLYYLDGQPKVILVTDGRAAKPLVKEEYESLKTGQCRICGSRQVAANALLKVALQCEDDYLLETDATHTCRADCASLSDSRDRAVCEHNCQQHSRCLEKSCVQSLRQELLACEQRCDQEMQSSMAADIDAFQHCVAACGDIRQQISTCPVL